MKKVILLSLLSVGFVATALAQFPPRIEDHFWRRKVVNRLDLEEKINAPLVKAESGYYRGVEDTTGLPYKDGLINSLFSGLMEGTYTAYDPDTLSKVMTSQDVIDRINRITAESAASTDLEEEAEGELGLDESGGDFGFPDEGGDGNDPFADPFADPFGDPSADPFNEGGGEDSEFGGTDIDNTEEKPSEGEGEASMEVSNEMPDLIPFEMVVQFVEDRIFDKNRSDMVYDIQYIEIIWVDPYGRLPERRLCTFAYSDVIPILEKTQWKNRFNDAQYRNMRQVFETRLFHSYVIDISGVCIQSLAEAEYRRQQLVEFEHHLWSY